MHQGSQRDGISRSIRASLLGTRTPTQRKAKVRHSVGRHLQRVFTVLAIRNPQIAEEKKSLMDGKKSAAVRAMAVLREAAGATSVFPSHRASSISVSRVFP